MSTEAAAEKPADDFLSGLDASDAEVIVTPDPVATETPPAVAPKAADATPPAKADATPPAKADAPPAADKSDNSVAGQNAPTAAMLAERRRLREEIAARDQRLETMEAELKALKAAVAPKAEPPPLAPDFAENPKGYVDTTVKSQTDRIAALEKQIKDGQDANENARKAQEAYTEALRQVREAEQEHMKNAPDYYDALEHSRNVRRSQIQILAPEATSDQIEAELTRQELATAFGMLKSGQNPAERAYAYAKTLGYTPKQAAAIVAAEQGKTTPDTQARAPDGKFTAPDPAEIEARKQAAASLGSGGNEALAAMENELGETGDVFDQAKSERFRR